MDLGTRIRELRKQAGMTGTALAQPRYTVSYVSQIESGRRRPSPDALAYFADRLGVSPDFLATGVPEGIEVSLRYRLEQGRHELSEGRPRASEPILRSVVEEAARFDLERVQALALAS